ncbi:MAG: hypothetical protein AB7O68_17375 [Pirellulales bacterium]
MTTSWRETRAEILRRLDPLDEAKKLGIEFTASKPSADGWLACRSPDREDNDPSAAINVGTGEQRGLFVDLGSGDKARSFFDLATKLRPDLFPDWRAAVRHYAAVTGVTLRDCANPISIATAVAKHSPLAAVTRLPRKALTNARLGAWCTTKPGITVEGARALIPWPCRWPVKTAERGFSCLAFEGRDTITGATEALVLYRSSGKSFPATTNLLERKTHLVRGSRDSWLWPGTPEQLAAAEVVVKVEGPTDLLALQPLLPAGWTVVTNMCGASASPERLDLQFLAGKKVFVIGDTDTAGQKGARRFAEAFAAAGAEVLLVKLPYEVADSHGKDLRDWVAEGHTFAELQELIGAAERVEAPQEPGGNLPTIFVNRRHLPSLSNQAMDALIAANDPPRLFQRGGQLVRIRDSDDREPLVEVLSEAALTGELARAARWVKQIPKGDSVTLVDTFPLREVVFDLLAARSWPLPVLESVVYAPSFAASGELLTRAGYHPASRVWHHQHGEPVKIVSGNPSSADLSIARALLIDELLGDFPFADQASRAGALAAFVQPFARFIVAGPSPIYVVDATGPASGKTLFVESLGIVVLGASSLLMTAARDDDEWRKRITAALLGGPPLVVIDNVRHKLDSSSLAAAVTADYWSDRVLGETRMVRVPVRTTWLATGNNITLSDEMTRRVVWIRLDPKCEAPEERTGFRHPDLLAWTRAHRHCLVWAALTLIQAWIARGRPVGTQTLGRFEAWAQVIGGILDVAGVPGLLNNRAELQQRAGEDRAEWRAFVATWFDRFQVRAVGTKELLTLAREKDLLSAVLGDKTEQGQKLRLSAALKSMVDRVVAGYRIEPAGHDHKSRNQFRLQPLAPPDPEDAWCEWVSSPAESGPQEAVFGGDSAGYSASENPVEKDILSASAESAESNSGPARGTTPKLETEHQLLPGNRRRDSAGSAYSASQTGASTLPVPQREGA